MSEEVNDREEEGLGAKPVRKLREKREARKAILEAGQKALKAGQIKSGDYAALWRASRKEENVAEIVEFLEDHESAAGNSDGLSAPDWNALIEKIMKALPLIIQLIGLFKV